jgi:hypothetical protein
LLTSRTSGTRTRRGGRVNQLPRRQFLGMAAAGSAAVAAAAALPVGILSWLSPNMLKFRAAVGMPKAPLPAFASLVIEGNVNLDRGTGTVRKGLFLGTPVAMRNIMFPGTLRTIQVTDVKRSGETVRIAGIVSGGAALGPRESPNVLITIDRAAGLARADFLGREVLLQVQ